MTGNNGFNRKHEAFLYPGATGEPEVRPMTAAEIQAALAKQEYDHIVVLPWDLLAFRTADGQWVERRLEGLGISGDTSLSILEAIQYSPGEFTEAAMIAQWARNENLNGGNALAARVRVLRRVHGERPQSPWFFVTRRRDYAMMWPAARSYLLIKPLKTEHDAE